jgi:hypothetical protein
VGDSIDLDRVVDLKEMGATPGLVGTVESIGAVPRIEGGVGRVVTTTVNHLNSFVFNLWKWGQPPVSGLNIDNNSAERALKRVAIGRNNWLFGAQTRHSPWVHFSRKPPSGRLSSGPAGSTKKNRWRNVAGRGRWWRTRVGALDDRARRAW